MKLLLDANISWRLVSTLNEHFGECVHVDNIQELESPASDINIWEYAKNNDYMIVSQDNDFNDIIEIRGFPPKIIWLKAGNCSSKKISDLLIRSKDIINEFYESEESGLLKIFGIVS